MPARHLLHRLTGARPGLFALTAMAIIAGAIAWASARRTRPPAAPSRAPLIFALLFATGVAFQLQLGARLQRVQER